MSDREQINQEQEVHDHTRREPSGERSCIDSVPIFQGLDPGEKREIALITAPARLKRGEMVYMAGDLSGTLYVLHKGRVKIFRISSTGREQVLRTVGPGDFLGELSLFSSLPQENNAQVTEDAVMCVIDGVRLKGLMARSPGIAFKIMDVLSRRLQMAETLLEAISLNTVEQRIAKALLSMSQDLNTFELVMTRGELASQLGMSQETLSRKLASLEDEGIIRSEGRRKIHILDRKALEESQSG